jgi:hypothetical protein
LRVKASRPGVRRRVLSGAPEEIRTPDPQIRRLLRVFVSKGFFCKKACSSLIDNQYVSIPIAK